MISLDRAAHVMEYEPTNFFWFISSLYTVTDDFAFDVAYARKLTNGQALSRPLR